MFSFLMDCPNSGLGHRIILGSDTHTKKKLIERNLMSRKWQIKCDPLWCESNFNRSLSADTWFQLVGSFEEFAPDSYQQPRQSCEKIFTFHGLCRRFHCCCCRLMVSVVHNLFVFHLAKHNGNTPIRMMYSDWLIITWHLLWDIFNRHHIAFYRR